MDVSSPCRCTVQVVRAACERNAYARKSIGTVFVAFAAPPSPSNTYKVVRPCVYSFNMDGKDAVAATLTVNRADFALKHVAEMVTNAACVGDTAASGATFANDVFAIANVKISMDKGQGGWAYRHRDA